jgi:hypothetical protein
MPMPSYKGQLSDKEVIDVMAYLASLKGRNENYIMVPATTLPFAQVNVPKRIRIWTKNLETG